MPLFLTRRRLLTATAALATVAAVSPRRARAAAPTELTVAARSIEVGGKAATVYGITRPDGGQGLHAVAGDDFRVRLRNSLAEPTSVHWHGLTPPWRQDGVAGVSQDPLPPGTDWDYDFPLTQPGTYWMHSHFGLQEQGLLAAPLIVADPAEAGLDEQEVVVMLHDFSFRDPAEILAGLRGTLGGASHAMTGGAAMPETDSKSMPMIGMDLNDVEYDAYLTNDRTLADPKIVRVDRGGQVRLRIINGAAATNFHIDLGKVAGTLVAVDGMAIEPIVGRRFPIAIAQRLDIRLVVPAGTSLPILALREGGRQRTGLILWAPRTTISRIDEMGEAVSPALDLLLEQRLVGRERLPVREVDRTIAMALSGDMANYIWTINGQVYGQDTPLSVRQGERVTIKMTNTSMMAHPMHLHGHSFQVAAIDDMPMQGARRDTVLVPPKRSVTIIFDADNPGHWAFHCHILYHMQSGMMTTLRYEE